MAGEIHYDRLILLMTDDELEKFCRAWVEKKTSYFEVKRFAGPGDKGRDVVGFFTDQRHEGAWDNYQCKQYRRGIDRSQGLLAIGKLLYWAWKGEFSAPDHFFFVAPQGLARKFEVLIDKPSELRDALIGNWDSVCAKSITQRETIVLDPALKAFIEKYPFKNVKAITLDEMIADPAVKPLLFERWGADPGKYPPGVVPLEVQGTEMRYIEELIAAYGEHAKAAFTDHDAVLENEDYGPDLRRQRERFFEADAFQKFYRDNTNATVLSDFRKDIEHGVADRWSAPAPDMLARVRSVMELAGVVTPAGPLAKYAHVPAKQGMCHHFVNDGEKTWKK